jgi:hypothetical protein
MKRILSIAVQADDKIVWRIFQRGELRTCYRQDEMQSVSCFIKNPTNEFRGRTNISFGLSSSILLKILKETPKLSSLTDYRHKLETFSSVSVPRFWNFQ